MYCNKGPTVIDDHSFHEELSSLILLEHPTRAPTIDAKQWLASIVRDSVLSKHGTDPLSARPTHTY